MDTDQKRIVIPVYQSYSFLDVPVDLGFNKTGKFAHSMIDMDHKVTRMELGQFFDCYCLNDDIPEERQRGIKNDAAWFKQGVISELRLYGDRISNGMRAEIEICKSEGITIRAMTRETNEQYNY